MIVHAWRMGDGEKYEKWGFIWKPAQKRTHDYWEQKLFCPSCYEKEKVLIPKKKSIFKRIFD